MSPTPQFLSLSFTKNFKYSSDWLGEQHTVHVYRALSSRHFVISWGMLSVSKMYTSSSLEFEFFLGLATKAVSWRKSRFSKIFFLFKNFHLKKFFLQIQKRIYWEQKSEIFLFSNKTFQKKISKKNLEFLFFIFLISKKHLLLAKILNFFIF